MTFIDLSLQNNSPKGINSVKSVMLEGKEYQNYIPLMVSETENARNLSQHLAKKQRFESFKTSLS